LHIRRSFFDGDFFLDLPLVGEDLLRIDPTLSDGFHANPYFNEPDAVSALFLRLLVT